MGRIGGAREAPTMPNVPWSDQRVRAGCRVQGNTCCPLISESSRESDLTTTCRPVGSNPPCQQSNAAQPIESTSSAVDDASDSSSAGIITQLTFASSSFGSASQRLQHLMSASGGCTTPWPCIASLHFTLKSRHYTIRTLMFISVVHRPVRFRLS